MVQHPGENEKSPGRQSRSKSQLLRSYLHLPGTCRQKGTWLVLSPCNRHVKNIIHFVRSHPNTVSKSAEKAAEVLAKHFTVQWKKKVIQLQVPLFAPNTKGAWLLRFDDILADAIEQGPLQNRDFILPKETPSLLSTKTPKGCPDNPLPMLTKYYLAHLQEHEAWVVLPISAIDAYCGNNNFSKKWKSSFPNDLLQFQNSYGSASSD